MMNNTNWFNEARYGMLIHWGADAVAARGEWAANRERIPLEEYKRLYADNFHADYPGPYFRDWPGMNDWKSDDARHRFILDSRRTCC